LSQTNTDFNKNKFISVLFYWSYGYIFIK